MSYILIKNRLEADQDVKKLVYEYLQRSGYAFDDDIIHVSEKDSVEITFKHKKSSDRYYLNLRSSMRINRGIEVLQNLDDSMFKSDIQRYFHIIRDYDGISESLAGKLYPKYAKFERRLRQLVLLVVTKSFGSEWADKTIKTDVMNELKRNAKSKGTLHLTDIIEQFDLHQLEEYLFGLREVDYQLYFQEKLSEQQLVNLEKDEICKILEEMRPKSLWKRNFAAMGDGDEWEKKIKSVHECRNKVAHHKRLKQEEYKKINKQLNVLIKDLNEAIEKIQDYDFTNQNSIDVLGNLAFMASRIRDAFTGYDFSKMFSNINSTVQKLTDAIKCNYSTDFTESLSRIGKIMTETASTSSLAQAYIGQNIMLNNLQSSFKVPEIDFEAFRTASQLNAVAQQFKIDSEKNEESEENLTDDAEEEDK